MKNIFFLAPESRWTYIIANAKQDDIALKIDTALHNVEKNNPSLKGALPDNYSANRYKSDDSTAVEIEMTIRKLEVFN